MSEPGQNSSAGNQTVVFQNVTVSDETAVLNATFVEVEGILVLERFAGSCAQQICKKCMCSSRETIINMAIRCCLSSTEVYGVMLLTAGCLGAVAFLLVGVIMSKVLARWHFYLWLPMVMAIVGFTLTCIIVFAPGFLFSVLVYTSNISEGGVELRLVIAMGLVQVRYMRFRGLCSMSEYLDTLGLLQGLLVIYFDFARWRQG